MKSVLLAAIGIVFLASCASTNNHDVTTAVRADLAPTGKLRAGINVNNRLLTRTDPATGETRGIAVDIALELGRRLGVPVELVIFKGAGNLADAAPSNRWDVGLIGADPKRATHITFTAPYAEIEATYLVPGGSSFKSIADVDRDGVRISVPAKSAYDLYLTRALKHATLVRTKGQGPAFKLLASGKADVMAGLRPVLIGFSAKLPGSRVLDGRYTIVNQAMASIKGREAGAKYLAAFVEDIKASGLVAQTIEKNRVKGVGVAPPAR